MIGIVVVSHGKLSKELVAATEHVVGEQMRFKSISINILEHSAKAGKMENHKVLQQIAKLKGANVCQSRTP